MTRFSAMLDACVLVPVTLADTLLRLAENGLYRPLWSARIIDETVQAIEEVHPQLSADAIRRRATAMDTAFGDASVTGWEALEDAISLPDADDCHSRGGRRHGPRRCHCHQERQGLSAKHPGALPH